MKLWGKSISTPIKVGDYKRNMEKKLLLCSEYYRIQMAAADLKMDVELSILIYNFLSIYLYPLWSTEFLPKVYLSYLPLPLFRHSSFFFLGLPLFPTLHLRFIYSSSASAFDRDAQTIPIYLSIISALFATDKSYLCLLALPSIWRRNLSERRRLSRSLILRSTRRGKY